MTDHDSADYLQKEITTEEDFQAALGELLMTAHRNGMDPLGSWVCRNGESVSDLEVMIYELEDGQEPDADRTASHD